MKLPSILIPIVILVATGSAVAEERPALDCAKPLQQSTHPLVFDLERELERPYVLPEDAWPRLQAASARLRRHLASRPTLTCFSTYPQERIVFTRWANRFVVPVLEQVDGRLDRLCTDHGRNLIDPATRRIAAALDRRAISEALVIADALDQALAAEILRACEPLAAEVTDLRERVIPDLRDRAARPAVARALASYQRRVAAAVGDTEAALASSGRDMIPVGFEAQAWRDLRADARDCLSLSEELRQLGAGEDEPVDGGLTLGAAADSCSAFLEQSPALAERSADHDQRCREARRQRFKARDIHGWGMHLVFEVHDIPDRVVEAGERIEWFYEREGQCRQFRFDDRGRALGERACDGKGETVRSEPVTSRPQS